MNPGGVYISSDLGYLAQNMYLPFISPIIKPLFGKRKSAFPYPSDIGRSPRLIKSLMEQDKFKAVIDREYPFEQIVKMLPITLLSFVPQRVHRIGCGGSQCVITHSEGGQAQCE